MLPANVQNQTEKKKKNAAVFFIYTRERQKIFSTFQTADPPQPRVGEGPGVFLVLVVGIVLADVGRAVADDGSGVQPVVRPDGHRHQAEGGEGPHGGEEDLDPLLTHHAFIQEERGRGGQTEVRGYRCGKH